MTMELHQARADGLLGNDDAVLRAVGSTVAESSTRAIDIRAWQGIDLRILPDRGFDLGQAWFAGTPLAWVSAVGEIGPLQNPSGFEWSNAFGGGLMVTCGLRNVGMPSEGHGLHGSFSHLPASDIELARVVTEDDAFLTAHARITDEKETPVLAVDRRIKVHALQGLVEVTDRTTNLGSVPVEAPLLYHFNFGYPLWDQGARLDIDVVSTTPRDMESEQSLGSWQLPSKVEETAERVLEHDVVAIDGWGSARLTNEALGVEVKLAWRVSELPRLHQWIDPSPGMCVLGIEPANCSTSGRAHDRALGQLPTLAPGEVRESALVIEANSL